MIVVLNKMSESLQDIDGRNYWMQLDSAVMMFIIDTVNKDIARRLGCCETASEMSKVLKQCFETRTNGVLGLKKVKLSQLSQFTNTV